MNEKGKYLYCVIKEKNQKEFNVLGIEGGKVYTISEGELSAVVSDAEIKEYPISRENTLTHQKVIEEAMKEYDILPISFGTVAESEKNIREKILKLKSKELSNALEKIKGKVELNIKAVWLDMSNIFREVLKENKKIQVAKKEASTISGIGKTNLAMEVGKMVASVLEEKKEREAREILKPLKGIAEDFKENKVHLDRIIFNTAFLVSKEKEKEFDEEVLNLGEKYDGRIKFLYVGPLPPFNFVELEFSLNLVRNF